MTYRVDVVKRDHNEIVFRCVPQPPYSNEWSWFQIPSKGYYLDSIVCKQPIYFIEAMTEHSKDHWSRITGRSLNYHIVKFIGYTPLCSKDIPIKIRVGPCDAKPHMEPVFVRLLNPRAAETQNRLFNTHSFSYAIQSNCIPATL